MMAFYRTSAPMPFYGGDYRPDDEPPPEAELEEKRILEHQFRRPSPSRWSASGTSSIRPPAVSRQQGTSRSLRARASGSSPRRSLQRSSAFSARRSTAIVDRGRTASMPAVPIVRKLKIFCYWKISVSVFWITVILNLDPDPVLLYRHKTENEHYLSNRKATVVSTIAKSLKVIVIVVQAIKSDGILKIRNDLQSVERRINSDGGRQWVRHRLADLTSSVEDFGALCSMANRTNKAFVIQLSLSVGLHFSSTLVDVYLLCFHVMTPPAPDTTTTTNIIGGVRVFNNLLRLSAISGAAHYTFKQALGVHEKLSRIRTMNLEAEDVEEIEVFFIQYDPKNFSFKLLGSLTLDFSLIILPSFGNVLRPDGPVLEEYRLRSFSITASGVCNLGDFVRYASPPSSTRHHTRHQPVGKRESCPASVSTTPVHLPSSICNATTSATSAATSTAAAANAASSHTVCTEFSRFRKPSAALINKFKANDTVESYKVALLGAPGVGKTTISVQFSTSDYICVYDTSIDEDCACRTIRVMINGQEAELTIIDIPYVEMSIETLCSTYNPNVFIVMYSVVDERSFDIAEQMLLFLWKGEYIHTRGVILVGNKSDLERTRKIQTNVGRNLAYSWNCKFIETSSGIDHNVDKLLVGILAQIKLNPLRERMYNSKRKKYSVTKLYKDFLAYLRGVKSSENLFSI